MPLGKLLAKMEKIRIRTRTVRQIKNRQRQKQVMLKEALWDWKEVISETEIRFGMDFI